MSGTAAATDLEKGETKVRNFPSQGSEVKREYALGASTCSKLRL